MTDAGSFFLCVFFRSDADLKSREFSAVWQSFAFLLFLRILLRLKTDQGLCTCLNTCASECVSVSENFFGDRCNVDCLFLITVFLILNQCPVFQSDSGAPWSSCCN